jgi:quercetin dioxygenase-like cupin family protein
MSRETRIRIEASVLAGLLALTGAASAQDPAVVNAKTIQLKLDNDRVRVLEAALKPGEKEQLHSHPAYVVYVVAGGKVRNHLADGKTSETEFKTGDVVYRDPLTHWAENIGTTTVRFILVELKNPK